MTLPVEDGKLFFELMWKLQYFVNQKRGIHKNISSPAEYANLSTEEKLPGRDELWKNPALIEAYVQENPHALSGEELGIIQGWTRFIKGSFFVFRHLKKGSIFIGKDDQVYAVHGIQDPLDEVIPSDMLPQMVEAILLPFKGRIIYDGLLSGYNIHFGGGIRSNLNRAYTAAKERNRLITTLEPELESPVVLKSRKNIAPPLKEITARLAKIKGESRLQNTALALARSSIELCIADSQKSLTAEEAAAQARTLLRSSRRLLELLSILSEE